MRDLALVLFQLCSLTFEMERFGVLTESSEIILLGAGDANIVQPFTRLKASEGLWIGVKTNAARPPGNGLKAFVTQMFHGKSSLRPLQANCCLFLFLPAYYIFNFYRCLIKACQRQERAYKSLIH